MLATIHCFGAILAQSYRLMLLLMSVRRRHWERDEAVASLTISALMEDCDSKTEGDAVPETIWLS